MKALGANVAVRSVERAAMSRGLYIPETARKLTQEAVVLSVGPGWKNDDGDLVPILDIHPGDRVLHIRMSGQVLTGAGGEEYRILPYDSIVASLLVGDFVECAMCKGHGYVPDEGE